jgi:transcriptional regulator with XRE-family HTH domain
VVGPRAYLLDLMAELDRAAISLRLGESLKAAGIKQPEMAELLRVHKSAVEQYVSPKVKTIPFDRLEEWGKLTGTTKEWLLHGDPLSPDQLVVLAERVEEVLAAVQELRSLVGPLVEAQRKEQPDTPRGHQAR